MKKKVKEYIELWEGRCYSDGIPDEVPNRIAQLHKAPSYKQICIAILNNDYPLKSLGLEPKKSDCYHLSKREELKTRAKETEQLEILNDDRPNYRVGEE